MGRAWGSSVAARARGRAAHRSGLRRQRLCAARWSLHRYAQHSGFDQSVARRTRPRTCRCRTAGDVHNATSGASRTHQGIVRRSRRPAPGPACGTIRRRRCDQPAPTAALLHWDETNGPYRAVLCPPDEILDRALATLAADSADLLTGPDADSLTTCDSLPCTRYLVRRGRQHWCSTRCGDRARAARAYVRAKSKPG